LFQKRVVPKRPLGRKITAFNPKRSRTVNNREKRQRSREGEEKANATKGRQDIRKKTLPDQKEE